MTEQTNGIFNQIEDFTALKEVMQVMVGAFFVPNNPEQSFINKNGNLIAITVDHKYIYNTLFEANLPHDLPLDMGANIVEVVSQTSETNQKKNGVTIQVSGPAISTVGPKELPGNSLFDLVCHYRYILLGVHLQ